MMLARSASEATAITSAAVGPSWPIRMSSGPPWRNEKPRSAWSSCIEDTPTSITTPSTEETPCAAQTSARWEKRSSHQREPASRLIHQIESAQDRGAVAVDADHAGSLDVEDGAAVAAGPEGGVDIDPAVAGAKHLDGLAAEHGNMTRSSRIHAPAPGADRGDLRKLDANGPIAPQMSALRRAFPVEKRRPKRKPWRAAMAASLRPTSQIPSSRWNLLGCHGDFERQRGPRPSPKPVRLFTT